MISSFTKLKRKTNSKYNTNTNTFKSPLYHYDKVGGNFQDSK